MYYNITENNSAPGIYVWGVRRLIGLVGYQVSLFGKCLGV